MTESADTSIVSHHLNDLNINLILHYCCHLQARSEKTAVKTTEGVSVSNLLFSACLLPHPTMVLHAQMINFPNVNRSHGGLMHALYMVKNEGTSASIWWITEALAGLENSFHTKPTMTINSHVLFLPIWFAPLQIIYLRTDRSQRWALNNAIQEAAEMNRVRPLASIRQAQVQFFKNGQYENSWKVDKLIH